MLAAALSGGTPAYVYGEGKSPGTPTSLSDTAGDTDTGQDSSGLADIPSRRILFATDDPSIIRDTDTITSPYGDVYLVQYGSTKEAGEAYQYYSGKADFVDYDTAIAAAEGTGETPSSTGTVMTAKENPLAELSAQVKDDKKQGDTVGAGKNDHPLVALIDSGANPDDSHIIGKVSMIGDNPDDDNGHGTDMAGAVTDIDPDARILSIKVLDKDGRGDISAVYAGIQYAIEKKAAIINLSMSAAATATNAALRDAVQKAIDAGIIVVTAAGNNGQDAEYYTPGNIKDAVVVGACDSKGQRIADSNYGNTVDYFVSASSTSEAASYFTGVLSAMGITNSWRKAIIQKYKNIVFENNSHKVDKDIEVRLDVADDMFYAAYNSKTGTLVTLHDADGNGDGFQWNWWVDSPNQSVRTTPYKTGYSIKSGFYTSPNGQGDKVMQHSKGADGNWRMYPVYNSAYWGGSYNFNGTKGVANWKKRWDTIDLYPDWVPNQYIFDLQSGSIAHGTADVWVNGSRVADDVRDWYQSYNYGSTITVNDIKPDTGYHNAGQSSYTQTLGTNGWTCNVDIRPNQYPFDLNDTNAYSIEHGTADVYVNGSQVADHVRDWYQSSDYGSTIVVNDIKPDTGYHNAGNNSYTYTMGTNGVSCAVNIQPNTYIVTYNANGGTGSTMPDSTVTYDTNFVTRKNSFTNNGYDFDGWNEKADGSGIPWTLMSAGVYENGDGANPWKWTYPYNITLYAQWRYYVQFDGNAPKDVEGNTLKVAGSVASMDSLYSGHSYALNKNQFSVYGYEFLGWSTDKNDTSPQYTDGGAISGNPTPNNGSTVTLYAIWKISSYPVTYKLQKDSDAEIDMPATVSLANKKTVVYPAHGGLYFENPRMTNARFTGWTCAELGVTDKTKDLTVSSDQVKAWYGAKTDKADNVGLTMVAHFESVPPFEFVDEKTGETPILNETEKNQGKFRIEEIESSPGYIYEDQYHDIDIRDKDDTHEYQDNDYRNLTFPEKNGK